MSNQIKPIEKGNWNLYFFQSKKKVKGGGGGGWGGGGGGGGGGGVLFLARFINKKRSTLFFFLLNKLWCWGGSFARSIFIKLTIQGKCTYGGKKGDLQLTDSKRKMCPSLFCGLRLKERKKGVRWEGERPEWVMTSTFWKRKSKFEERGGDLALFPCQVHWQEEKGRGGYLARKGKRGKWPTWERKKKGNRIKHHWMGGAINSATVQTLSEDT